MFSELFKEDVVICKVESSEEVGIGFEELEEVLECIVIVSDE